MIVTETELRGVLHVEPKVFPDERGFFLETFNGERYAAAGLPGRFVQDNLAYSRRGVLRGLHLQHPGAQGKLVFVLAGAVFDVAVDVRVGSPTFGRWVSRMLTAESKNQLYIAPGLAHGYLVTSDHALLMYKCTEHRAPDAEIIIRWDDPAFGISWPAKKPVLSAKDAAAPVVAQLADGVLPRWTP